MEIVKAIYNNGGLEPEENKSFGFGSHCDGELFYFFESKEEYDKFIEQLNNNN